MQSKCNWCKGRGHVDSGTCHANICDVCWATGVEPDKTLAWKLWVDDQLDDPDQPWRHVPEGFFGAVSVEMACNLVEAFGPPFLMDLDCDLGEGGEVKDFLKWLQENWPEDPPDWNVHSKNVVAGPFVDSFMKSWHRVVFADGREYDPQVEGPRFSGLYRADFFDFEENDD